MKNKNLEIWKRICFMLIVLMLVFALVAVNIEKVKSADETETNLLDSQKVDNAKKVIEKDKPDSNDITNSVKDFTPAQKNDLIQKLDNKGKVNLWNALDKTGRDNLLKDTKDSQGRNDFVKEVLNKDGKAPNLKNVNLKGANLEATTDRGIKVQGGPELTVNKWSQEINYNEKDKTISAVYANQGINNQNVRTINFPKDAKSLLDENGKYNGVDVLYGEGGTINIISGNEKGDVYSFKKNKPTDQPAIAVGKDKNKLIYSGDDAIGIFNNMVINSRGNVESWFNINYNSVKPTEAASYGYIKMNADQSITNNQASFDSQGFKGVLLKTDEQSESVTDIKIRNANGVSIIAGGNYVGNSIAVTAETSQNVMVARFSSGKITTLVGLSLDSAYEGNVYTSSNINPIINPGSGSMSTGVVVDLSKDHSGDSLVEGRQAESPAGGDVSLLNGKHYNSQTNTLIVQGPTGQYDTPVKVSRISNDGSWILSSDKNVYSYCTNCGGNWLFRPDVSPSNVGL